MDITYSSLKTTLLQKDNDELIASYQSNQLSELGDQVVYDILQERGIIAEKPPVTEPVTKASPASGFLKKYGLYLVILCVAVPQVLQIIHRNIDKPEHIPPPSSKIPDYLSTDRIDTSNLLQAPNLTETEKIIITNIIISSIDTVKKELPGNVIGGLLRQDDVSVDFASNQYVVDVTVVDTSAYIAKAAASLIETDHYCVESFQDFKALTQLDVIYRLSDDQGTLIQTISEPELAC